MCIRDSLAEMARIGLPVPPGFTSTTEVCTYYYYHGCTYPAQLDAQVDVYKRQVLTFCPLTLPFACRTNSPAALPATAR